MFLIILQGIVYRLVMRQALEAVLVGEARGDVLMQTRAWKLFFLVPLPSEPWRSLAEESSVDKSGSLQQRTVERVGRDECDQFH